MNRLPIVAGCLLAAVASGAELQGNKIQVDHVTIAGRDLADLRAKFAAAGIPTEYGGKHTNGLTEMALASFPDGSYLELIAAQDPKTGAGSHYWAKFIDENAGPCAWAIASSDVSADAARLGVHITDGGRKRADGVELHWKSAPIGNGIQGTFFPFMIQDVTDRKLRSYPSGKPTTTNLRGVAAVYTAVKDLDSAIAQYQTTFGLGEPERTTDKELGARLARFKGTPVVLATADGDWLKARLGQFGEGPCAFVLAAAASTYSPLAVKWLPIPGMKIGVIGRVARTAGPRRVN
jgi:Glyoxalase-like domain